jgi:hypothetical protein
MATQQQKDKTTLMRAFNKCFYDFMDDILSVFDESTHPMHAANLKHAKKNCELLQAANPALLIKSWYQHVYSKYAAVIDSGDTDFILNKDYTEDLGQFDAGEQTMKIINTFREPLKNMSPVNIDMAMRHIQTLSKISDRYMQL